MPYEFRMMPRNAADSASYGAAGFPIFATKKPSVSLSIGQRRRHPATRGSPSSTGGLLFSGKFISKSSASECRPRNQDTTPSSSSGSRVHVEYTRMPPGFRQRQPVSSRERWVPASLLTPAVDHISSTERLLRTAPVAEQGASTSTRSKASSAGK